MVFDVASLPQWHLDDMDTDELWSPGGWRYSPVGVVPGWPAGAEVVVAVIDSGVDGSHRDLGANVLDIAEEVAGLGHDCHLQPSDPHGTHVAGIIAAAQGNAQDVAGVAPRAKILPIRVHFSKDFDDWKTKANPKDPACFDRVPTLTRAIDLARLNGADVINLSLSWVVESEDWFIESQVGADAADDAPHVGRDTVEWAIQVARLQDVVVVASAGNCGDSRVYENRDEDGDGQLDERPNGDLRWFVRTDQADRSGTWEHGWEVNDCGSHNQRQRPARYPNAISVAAIEDGDARAVFSSVNNTVDIAAPGARILSTVLAYTADATAPCTAGATCHVAHLSGTSMAAPMVAAVVAHIKARYPDLDWGVIVGTIAQTARPAPSGSTRDEYGAGIIDPVAALEAIDIRVGTPVPEEREETRIPGGSDQAVITIAAGADAQGAPGPNGNPCTGVDCRYVEISLTNVPEGDYTVECYSSANPNQPWHTATWHWPNNTQWTQGGCTYNTPGGPSLDHRHQPLR